MGEEREGDKETEGEGKTSVLCGCVFFSLG